jgi:t-SNARE complex subunit (syntaxin)
MEVISEHLKRIEQVDQIARDSLQKNQVKLPEKYANIEATLKLLTNLINAFRKRADTYEQDLKHRAKIDDLTDQIRLHRARIADC